ncbi:cupin domain-containing protein [Blastopirellula sp. J2-11]|uniref:cupin domain-containing protein n=1 Tax=Blastopirellula sp. J2-11 TaxID=2943192 RepID=UPI0021C6B67B|nr:cupin domain-containing protein [Blastopirellula sp. J2-11]UUO04901.1 cupin domain-containing protein [Blastopirellula sp. J2-11]
MIRFSRYVLFSLGLVIVAGLGIAWAHEDGGPLKVTVLAKSTDAWDGKPLPTYPAGQPEITILRIVIPAGEKTPLHLHTVINAGVLLRGELVVHTENGLSKRLKAGDSLIELVNKPHWGANDGKVDAEIIVFYAGIQGEKVTKKLDDHADSPDP